MLAVFVLLFPSLIELNSQRSFGSQPLRRNPGCRPWGYPMPESQCPGGYLFDEPMRRWMKDGLRPKPPEQTKQQGSAGPSIGTSLTLPQSVNSTEVESAQHVCGQEGANCQPLVPATASEDDFATASLAFPRQVVEGRQPGVHKW